MLLRILSSAEWFFDCTRLCGEWDEEMQKKKNKIILKIR